MGRDVLMVGVGLLFMLLVFGLYTLWVDHGLVQQLVQIEAQRRMLAVPAPGK